MRPPGPARPDGPGCRRGSLNGLPGALLVGKLQDQEHGGLHCLGSVGTGFTDRDRTDLARLLAVAAVDTCPFATAPAVPGARWVLPGLVAEVRLIGHGQQNRLDTLIVWL